MYSKTRLRLLLCLALGASIFLVTSGCSKEVAGKVTKEAARAAGKTLRQWQDQNR